MRGSAKSELQQASSKSGGEFEIVEKVAYPFAGRLGNDPHIAFGERLEYLFVGEVVESENGSIDTFKWIGDFRRLSGGRNLVGEIVDIQLI